MCDRSKSNQQIQECIQSIILEQQKPLADSHLFEDSVEKEVQSVGIIGDTIQKFIIFIVMINMLFKTIMKMLQFFINMMMKLKRKTQKCVMCVIWSNQISRDSLEHSHNDFNSLNNHLNANPFEDQYLVQQTVGNHCCVKDQLFIEEKHEPLASSFEIS